jgi:hypothetical protein
MRITTLTIALLLSATACAKTLKVETDPSRGAVDIDTQKPGVPETFNATLSSANGSTITGTAKGTTASGMSHVTVTISGAAPGETHPWHIHEGKCSDAGAPVVGPASSYPPLTVGADGTATATADVPVELNEAKNYIINFLKSPTDMGTIGACGVYND